MTNRSVFPKSARTAWLLRNTRRTRPPRISPGIREQRLLARELARELREATPEQLTAVARILGHSAKWLELVQIEAHNPGAVGRATLRASR